MKNKIFEINVDFETKSAVDTDLIKIVKGDYNSIEFDLKMDKTDYKRAVLFLVKPSKKNFVVDIANSKAIFTEKNTFDEVGIYYYGIVLYGTNSKLTTSTKGKIQVVEGYNEDNEDITGDDNYPILDKLIEEVTDLKDKINASLGVMNKTFKEVTYDPSTGVMSFKNLNNEVTNINLPLSLLISSASYDNDNKKIVLTLANNDTIDIPILDLVSNYYDDKINANKEHIASTSNELYRLKTDVLETGESSRNNIHLEDSAMAEYQELSIDGVCEQETTTGRNLFDVNDCINKPYSTLGEDGWITSVCDNTDGDTTKYMSYCTNNLPLKTSTQYALFVEVQSVSGTLHPEFASTHSTSQNITNIYRTSITTGIHKFLITTRDDFSSTTSGIRTVIAVPVGSNTSITYRISVLEDTNITPETFEYEPYTGGQPSPSPDFPQEIKTITDSLKITSCNKNLLDSNREVNSTFISSIKEALETYKTTGKYATGYLTSSNSITSYNVYTTCFVKIKANTNYCISDNSIENKGFSCISILDKDGNVLYHSPDWQGSVYRINGLPNACYVAFGTRTTNYINVQLEEGTTNTSYEQHLETQITANIPDGEFIGKINDTYKDTLNVVYKDDGHYHLILNKMIGKVVLDGSETITINNTGTANWYYTIKKTMNNSVGGVGLSNYYKYANISNSNTVEGFAMVVSPKSIRIRYGTEDTPTNYKNWLSTHNTEVYYLLATPYEVDLGIVDTLLSYDEVTNIFSDSDLYPVINVKYYRNFIKTIQNLQVNTDTLKNELSNIESRLVALENANTSEIDNNPSDDTQESEVTE